VRDSNANLSSQCSTAALAAGVGFARAAAMDNARCEKLTKHCCHDHGADEDVAAAAAAAVAAASAAATADVRDEQTRMNSGRFCCDCC
jgi:hypothetical protein